METWRPVVRHRAIMPIPTGSIAAEILPLSRLLLERRPPPPMNAHVAKITLMSRLVASLAYQPIVIAHNNKTTSLASENKRLALDKTGCVATIHHNLSIHLSIHPSNNPSIRSS